MTRAIPGSVFLALVLAACGGGGGGGGPTPPPGPPATGPINSDTVLVVSSRAADAVFQSGGFGDITNFVGLTSVSANDAGGLAQGKVAKPVDWYVSSQVPVGPDTTSCAVRGTVTVSGDIANPLTVTPGDFLDYLWDQCDDGIGQVIDGFIGMTFTAFEGNLLAGQILLGVSLDIQNFQVTEGLDFDLTNGDLILEIDSRTQPETLISTLGNSLSIRNNSGTDTLSSFVTTVVQDNSMFPIGLTTDATGTITSTQFSGFVTYDTPVELLSNGLDYPHTGELVIFGTGNATIRLIAVSETAVRIEADYDGDGASDATIDTSWSALIGS